MDENKLLRIKEAAEILGVSIDTLRRWDKSGKLVAIRKDGGVHRYYSEKDLEVFKSDLTKIAYEWLETKSELPATFYCSNSAVFQARLITMQNQLAQMPRVSNIFSLIVAIAGEIGNNSFDHNLGKWPDVPGIFFGYNLEKGMIVLADRGLGVLHTLKRVRPELQNHTEAVKVAFTEIITGRAPEERGNGLKFVREIVEKNPISIFFRSGDAELRLVNPNKELRITRSHLTTPGCLAIVEF